MADKNLNLIIVHARGASKGVGLPANNENNHPFTSDDKSLALIHNGRIDDCEYNVLKKKYSCNTGCDSEILLRIIEGTEDCGSGRLDGIRDVFSLINHGHMAVALAERPVVDERKLWLFRNQHRPLWVVDLRKHLNQIFFVSEPNIWHEAVMSSQEARMAVKEAKVIEMPPNEVWHLELSGKKRTPSANRLMVQKGPSYPWKDDGQRFKSERPKPEFSVHTLLDGNDSINTSEVNPEHRLDLLNYKCDSIIDYVNSIRQQAEQLSNDNLISQIEFDQLVADLDRKKNELEEISTVIQR